LFSDGVRLQTPGLIPPLIGTILAAWNSTIQTHWQISSTLFKKMSVFM